MELRHLRYFVAVADHAHVGRAAESLHIRPSTLSQQLRQLEQELGHSLFIRTTRRVVLTDVGAELLVEARAILDATRRLTEHAAALRRPTESITVGYYLTVPTRLLEDLKERRPKGRLEVVHHDFTDPSAGLRDWTSDVAFVWPPLDQEGLEVLPLLTLQHHVLLPSRHRLARRREVCIEELATEEWIDLASPDPIWRAYWTAAAYRSGPAVGPPARNFDELISRIRLGSGVALVVESTNRFYRQPGICYRPVLGLPAARYAAAWHRSDTRPAINAVTRYLRRTARRRTEPSARRLSSLGR